MAERGVRDVCDMLRDAIEFIERDIAAKEARVVVLTERLEQLQGQPDPDLGQIAALQEELRELEAQLKSDRPQLTGFREEFAAACGPM